MSYDTANAIPFRRSRRMEDLRYRIAGRVFRTGEIEVAGEYTVTPRENDTTDHR